jgi:hypothetical protein
MRKLIAISAVLILALLVSSASALPCVGPRCNNAGTAPKPPSVEFAGTGTTVLNNPVNIAGTATGSNTMHSVLPGCAIMSDSQATTGFEGGSVLSEGYTYAGTDSGLISGSAQSSATAALSGTGGFSGQTTGVLKEDP